MEGQYSGVDILEALESAHNYNDYLTSLVRSSTESKELIDFGAGIGTFSKRLRSAGYHIKCVEPDSAQRKKLEQEGFDAVENISSVPDDSASFIFSLNVFEHIEQDTVAIQDVCRKLKPGGTLLIYVPAFECLWTSLDEKVFHYRRYTKRTLRRLVEQEGFTIDQVRYADCLGFIAAFIFRLLNRSPSTLTAAAISWYDRWLFAPSRVLDRLFGRWFGKNVYVLCRKRLSLSGP
ncbi:MAG TPA: class I SAM-dependent methyltransferase [Candidatus Udaeobacter sp.]|jgi:SAM-dependent methyltransferase|nr:class I SAM-dependent methyltransferase [Candidatus Udaeobacter sp.]